MSRDVAVRLDAHLARLKAFIVPAKESVLDDPEDLERALRHFAGERLTDAERPASFAFGPSLPLSDMGKAMDW